MKVHRQTANEVLELVGKVADSGKRHDLVVKIDWLFYRSHVIALVKKIGERERDLELVLTLIAAYVLGLSFKFNILIGNYKLGITRDNSSTIDLTAIVIARRLGYDDIYSILAPVIRHALPAATLTFLQARFHELLWAELEDCGPLPLGGIRLPPLAALTELERPEVWFPLALYRNLNVLAVILLIVPTTSFLVGIYVSPRWKGVGAPQSWT